MKTVFIEAVGIQPGGQPGNHGKFSVARFEQEEWDRPSEVDAEMGQHQSLLARTGWGREHFQVMDLQTGEGSLFRLGGHPQADLGKHAIWVCPLFEPFLAWLYDEYRSWNAGPPGAGFLHHLSLRPKVDIELPLEFAGYRRQGPQEYQDVLRGLLEMVQGSSLDEDCLSVRRAREMIE